MCYANSDRGLKGWKILRKQEEEEKMMEMEFLSYKISKLKMENNLKSSCKLKLINSVSSECNWINGIAVITLTQTLQQCRHPNQFYIQLILEGEFLSKEVKNIADKQEIHAIGHQKLLVYANTILSQLAVNTGLDGLNIKHIPLKQKDINFGPKPAAVKNEKIIRLCPNDE